jgi:hypothetical protein
MLLYLKKKKNTKEKKKSWDPIRIYQLTSTANPAQFSQIMAGLAVLVIWWILYGSQDFFHTFSIALCHKWDVKSDFAYVLQFFSIISDGLGSVN